MGVVSKAWLNAQKNRSSIWNVKATYIIDGKTFQTSAKADQNKTLMLGDTVTIIFSPNTLEMSEIKELIYRYNK